MTLYPKNTSEKPIYHYFKWKKLWCIYVNAKPSTNLLKCYSNTVENLFLAAYVFINKQVRIKMFETSLPTHQTIFIC